MLNNSFFAYWISPTWMMETDDCLSCILIWEFCCRFLMLCVMPQMWMSVWAAHAVMSVLMSTARTGVTADRATTWERTHTPVTVTHTPRIHGPFYKSLLLQALLLINIYLCILEYICLAIFYFYIWISAQLYLSENMLHICSILFTINWVQMF